MNRVTVIVTALIVTYAVLLFIEELHRARWQRFIRAYDTAPSVVPIEEMLP